jgi:DNA-binding transcriptional ArsR family regulator
MEAQPGAGLRNKCRESGRTYAVDMPKRNGPGIELLADPTRRRILTLLAAQPMRSAAIARELGRSRPATSRQLRLLEEAGLVRGWASMMDGRGVVYAIDARALRPIVAWLAGTWTGAGWQPEEKVSTDRSASLERPGTSV